MRTLEPAALRRLQSDRLSATLQRAARIPFYREKVEKFPEAEQALEGTVYRLQGGRVR